MKRSKRRHFILVPIGNAPLWVQVTYKEILYIKQALGNDATRFVPDIREDESYWWDYEMEDTRH